MSNQSIAVVGRDRRRRRASARASEHAKARRSGDDGVVTLVVVVVVVVVVRIAIDEDDESDEDDASRTRMRAAPMRWRGREGRGERDRARGARVDGHHRGDVVRDDVEVEVEAVGDRAGARVRGGRERRRGRGRDGARADALDGARVDAARDGIYHTRRAVECDADVGGWGVGTDVEFGWDVCARVGARAHDSARGGGVYARRGALEVYVFHVRARGGDERECTG